MSTSQPSISIPPNGQDAQGALMASLEGAILDCSQDDDDDSDQDRDLGEKTPKHPSSRSSMSLMANGRAGSTADRAQCQTSASLMMQSSNGLGGGLPDVLTSELQTLNLHAPDEQPWSFTLLKDNEELSVDSPEALAAKLGCHPEKKAKVVSIVGNSGEGKSFALNRVFFEGQEIFPTSNDQHVGTLGVSAALQPCQNVLVLDTEGFLGAGGHAHRRTRLLLKVLAVSDIVIYKTKAERLHNDLFHFLGDASQAYTEHFSAELKRVSQAIGRLGPVVIIFHETRHTAPLRATEAGVTPEDQIRRRVAAQNQDVAAFSRLIYFGHCHDPEGDSGNSSVYGRLSELIATHVADTSIRSPRTIDLIFRTIQVQTSLRLEL